MEYITVKYLPSMSLILLIHVLFVTSYPARSIPSLQCREIISNGRETRIDCAVYAGNYVDYRDIRKVTAATSDSQKYNVSIACYGGGRIYLPFPFRAKNVVSLNVYGCDIEGYLAEKAVPQILPDELRYVSLVNVNLHVSMGDIVSMITHIRNMSEEFECGPRRAQIHIFKNIQYKFTEPANIEEEALLMEYLMTSNIQEELITATANCSYPFLTYLEQSGSRSLSKIHFKLLEGNSYPQLRIFSFRNNSLQRIPKELENLNLSFLPNLRTLDLSENEITNPEFIFTHSQIGRKHLYIDLRRNSITSLTGNALASVVKSGHVILDLRENPLRCSCELFLYKEYLLHLQAKNTNVSAVLDMICESLEGGVLRTYNVMDHDFGRTFCISGATNVVK